MSATTITLIVTLTAFIICEGTSLFVYGYRTGRMSKDIEYMRRDIALIMTFFKMSPADRERYSRRR